MDFDREQLFRNVHSWLSGYDPKPRDGRDPVIFRGGGAHPIHNGVIRTVDADLDQAIEQAREYLAGVAWLWWSGDDSRPGLAEELLARGARDAGGMPVMAVRIDDVTAPEFPPELLVEEVAGRRALREWVEAYAEPMGVPAEKVGDALETERNRSDAEGSYRRFVGRVDGRVVSTSAVLTHDDTAGVYVVATAEPFQRRGYGTAMTAAALRAARRDGATVGTLQASAAGEPVYERMGFRTVAGYRLLTI